MNCYFLLGFLALLFLRFDVSDAAGSSDVGAKNPAIDSNIGRSNIEARPNLNPREKRQYNYGSYGSYGGYGGYPSGGYGSGVGLGTNLGVGLGRK